MRNGTSGIDEDSVSVRNGNREGDILWRVVMNRKNDGGVIVVSQV